MATKLPFLSVMLLSVPVNYAYTAKKQYQNSKQIFPEKELRGLSPNIHIHVSVSYLYIPTIRLPILLQENMWTNPGNI
jgi:hypothetical protein